MPDFDKNLQPIIKKDDTPSIDVKIKAPTPVAPVSPVGFGGQSDYSGPVNVFDKLTAATKNSDFTEKGIFITNKELSENKRYSAFNPTIPNYEDFAAYGQSNWDKAANGLLKGVNLAGTTVAGGLGMLLYGAPKAIFGGKLSYLWDNEIMNGLDQWNTRVDNEYLPNYYTQAEKDAAWYSTTNWLTTNFLFDKLIKNSGFAVGAMVSGNIANAGLLRLGAAAGRAAASGAAAAEASQAFKIFTPLLRNTARAFSAGKNIEAAEILERQISSIADVVGKSSQLGNIAKSTAGQFARFNDAARRTAISLYSSAGEASFEALQTAKEYRENLIEDYKNKYGEEPIGEALREIDQKAEQVGKTSFLGNMALLSVTEFTQLPYLMGSTYNASRQAANSLVGKVDDVLIKQGRYVAKETPTAVGKIAEKITGVGRYVFDPKEAAQEVGQYALQVGTQNYFNKSALSDDASVWTDGFLYGLFGKDENKEGVGALVSKEGMESLVLGGITGGLMQARGAFKEKKATTENTKRFLEELNGSPSFKAAFKDRLDAANRGVVLQQQQENAVIRGNRLEAKDLHTDITHNYLAPRIKYGRFDMVMDDISELRMMSATVEGLASLKEQGVANVNDTIETYQARLNNFERVAKVTNDIYQSTNIRYSGVTLPDGSTRKYSPYVIDKMVYAAAKIADYDLRIPQLNNVLLENNIVTGDMLTDVLKGKKPSSQATAAALNAINDLSVTSDIKDELKVALQDMIELGSRRKAFMEEYEDIKENPLNYESDPEFNVGDTVEVPVSVEQPDAEEGVKKLEIGKEYSLDQPVRKEDGKLILAPKLTVLSQTLGGELEVRLPSGKTSFLAPEEFDQFVISEEDNASEEMEDTLNNAIKTVLKEDKYKDIEKPEENLIEFVNSLDNQELINDVEEEFNKQVESIIAEKLAAQERIKQLLKNKEQIEKEQIATELNSGNVGSTPVQEGAVITEGKLKDYRQLFTSGITESEDFNDPTQSAPHVKRSREFLNNAKNFKNRNKLAAILVTPNQEVALGLSGLTQLSYGTNDMSDSTNVDKGFVAQVFVETDGGKIYFVDKDGNRIGEVGQPVDLQQVVFQTMPTTALTDSQGNPRYRANQKAEAEAQQRGWTTKRAELFDAPAFPVKAYQFTISRGVRRENKIDGKYERSHVGGILIPEEKIATIEGLLKISEGTITHNGVSITIPKGYTVLQYGDTLDIVNNNKFGQKKAKAIYGVLKAFAEDIIKQSEAGKEVKFNRNYTTFLENVLYWRKTADTQGNQIFVDSSNIYLGGNRYSITDVANLEKEIVDQLSETYHNINGKTLSSKFSEPFYEYVLEDGNLTEKEWRNYQSYLLSAEGRSAQETPLVTNAAKPTPELPYSFKQKYATLIDFELPVVAAPPKPVTPGVPMVGEFEMNGTTVNTFNGFNSGPIDFTGTVAPDGGISVDVKPNKTIAEVADNKQVVNGNIVPALKDANLFDPTADDNQLVITYIANRLIVELDKIRGAQQQQAPTPTAPTAAPVSDARADVENINISLQKDLTRKEEGDSYDIILGNKKIGTVITGVERGDRFVQNILIEKEFTGKGYGKQVYIAIAKLYPQENIYSFEAAQSDQARKMWDSFVEKGLATKDEVLKKYKLKTINVINAELDALEGAKPAEGTYNPDDTGAPADDYMRVAPKEEGGEKLTDAEIELFKQWATENVPGIPFEILDNLVNTYDNQKAWGVFEDGVAKFYRGALKGTPYHEVFEGIWKGFLTPEQRQAILDEFRAKSGKFKDRASGKMIFYEEATDQQAKERIADDFASFRTGKIAAKSLGQKILDFFKKIIEFFKNFVRKPSLKNELFKAIDSGKFKEAKLPAGIESTRPEYQRIAGLSETQAFEFTQDMTARAANYIFGDNKKSLYDIKEITSKEIFDRIKEAYASPQERKYQQLGEERFNQLVKRSKEALRTLGINFNEEDRIDINDESVSKNDYAPEPFNVDWKKNSPFAIKFVLATLPQVEPMNQQNSTSMELPKRVISTGAKGYLLNNFNRAFATVLDKLSNTFGVKKATEKLSDLAKFDATYVRFFQRVGGDLSTGTFDFSKFKDEDWRLFVNFMQTFTRQKPDALIQYIKGNEVYTAPANQFTAAKELERQWLESIKAISTNPEAAIRYNRVTKTYEANLEAFPERVPKNADQMVQFLGNVGIQFPLESYVRLRGEQQEEFATAVSRIYDYLKDARTGEMTSKGLKISGPLSTLSNLFIKSTNPNQDSTYFGVQGQRIQSFTDNNTPSLFENEFNESETIEELLTKRPELNDVFSKNSVTLKKGGRFVNEDGKIVGKFKVAYIQGTKNITSNAGKTTSEISIGDRFTQEINQNINGNYYILVPADGSTEWMMNLGNHVSFADIEGGARGWNKLYTIFKGYLKDDIALAMDYKNREDLKSVGAKARELRFFKEILAPKNLRDINALILRGATETEINSYIDNNISDINESVKSFIESTADQTISTLKDNSQVLTVKEGVFAYPLLDSQFAEKEKLNRFKLGENDLKNIATFVNANYIINNIEFHKILFGDPYQFAIEDGKLDETKRIKSFLSPRRTTIDTPEFNTFLNEDYNKSGDVALKPGDPGYHVHKDHAKTITFKDVKFGTSMYPKVNEADAASWIMDNTFREVKLKNGQWNKEAEDWHQWQMAYMRRAIAKKGKWSYEGREALQKADNELLSKPEPTFVTEVLKPIVSGVKTNENKIDLVLDKFSQMPLYYKAIEGTNLEKLYLKMMENGIGYAVMQSGRKVGATKLNKFYTADGKFNEAPFEGIVSVPWKAYGIQVENSFESEKEQTRGSQLTKLFSLDFFDNGKASEAAKSEFEKNRTLLKQLHEQGYNQLLKKLGITDLGDGFELKDKKAIQETLEYEMLRRELSENAKDTIQLDENGEFRIPFEASPSYQQIKDILYSLVNKALVSPKMNGGPKVQVPVTGFEKGDRDPNNANSELKFYTKKDPYMEVYLPHWFRNKFNKNKFPTDESILNYLNKSDEGKKILTGIGFRIPTQSMSSVEVFRVKGFLPQSMGDTIVVPSEVTAKSGSDFDIDKMNTYLRSVYVDKNGDVRLVKYRGSEEATREFYGNVFDDVLAGKAVKKDDLFEALQIRKYDLDDPKNLVDRYGNLLDTLLSEVEDEAELEVKLEQELLKLGDKNLQARLKDRFVDDMYKRSLENEYYDSLERMITLPENFERLISPVNDAGLKETAQELDDLMGVDETKIKNRLLDRNYMTDLRHSFVTAKKWVGIAAVNITGQSLTQKSQVYIDPARFTLVSDFDQKWLGDGSIVLPHNKVTIDGKTYVSISGKTTADGKQFISDRLSGYATSFVDVSKDPYIMKIIKSDSVVGVFMFLERIGAGENAIWFMNQPIVTEYLRIISSTGGRGLFSKANITAALSMFPARTEDVKAAKIDVAKLKENIQDYSKGALGGERNAEQQKILMEFLKYAKMANYSFKLTQATNYDTTKFRNSDSFSRKATRTDIANQTNIFSSADKILESSFIGDQKELIDKAMSAMGEALKLEKDSLRIITDDVLRPYSELEYLSKDDFDRIASKLKASFLDYIIQTKTGLNLEIKDLIVDLNKSVAAQLVEAQKNHPEIKILNDLTVVSSDKLEGGAKTIKLKANVKDAYDENMYTEMMRELRDNPDTRDLYYDIVTLSILQGTYQSAVSIKNIIPVEDFSDIIKPIIDTLESTPEVQLFSNGMFQRNNWKDEAIVPSITPFFRASEEPVGMILVGTEEEEVFRYSSPSFPNLPAFAIKDTDRRVLLLSETYNSEAVQYDFVKVPRVVKTKTGAMLDMQTGRSIFNLQKVKRIASGETALNDVYGYQKVKYANGDPVVTAKGEHVYKLVNLYGDGALVSEYYTDGRKSVIDNNTVKIDTEIPDADLIRFFAPRIETKAVPSTGEIQAVQTTEPVVSTELFDPSLPKINIYAGTGENADLSNFAIRPFQNILDGKRYQSVEQAFQIAKYDYADVDENDSDDIFNKQLVKKMRSISDGAELKKLGRTFKNLDSKSWDKDSLYLMKSFIRDSFGQNPAALERLLATGNAELTHTQDKGKWGKEFPKLLMEVRRELTEPTVPGTETNLFEIKPEGLPPINNNNENSCG